MKKLDVLDMFAKKVLDEKNKGRSLKQRVRKTATKKSEHRRP